MLNNLKQLKNDLEMPSQKVSMILLDIKSFSKLNKTYGNNVAAFILDEFIKNIKNVLKKDGTVYQIYLDQFAIYYDVTIDLKYVNDLSVLLKSFVYKYKTSEFILDVTIGFANGTNNNILQYSTLALKEAKIKKIHIFEFCNDIAVNDEYKENITKLNKLNESITNDGIVPYFMPMYDTNKKCINKYEILARMLNDEGISTPDKFLDVSISSGKYHVITQNVLIKTFDYIKNISDIQFSINIGLSDINNEKTMNILFEKLENYEYSSNIIIEILESENIVDFDLLNSFIQRVKKYNVKVAIDDFGSGYANFNYIANLEIDIVKLDSSLIEKIMTNQKSLIIVKNILRTIKELNLEVVAENVYSEEIAYILIDLGVDYLQGYYIGKAQKDIEK